MKTQIEIPDRYLKNCEPTGEFRPPMQGELFINQWGILESGESGGCVYPRMIVRRKATIAERMEDWHRNQGSRYAEEFYRIIADVKALEQKGAKP